MKVSEALIEGRKLISKRENWLREWYAYTHDMIKVQPEADAACRFCSVGALRRVAFLNRLNMDMQAKMQMVLNSFMNQSIVFFNDGRSHDEVLTAWDKAIKFQQEKEHKELNETVDIPTRR